MYKNLKLVVKPAEYDSQFKVTIKNSTQLIPFRWTSESDAQAWIKNDAEKWFARREAGERYYQDRYVRKEGSD